MMPVKGVSIISLPLRYFKMHCFQNQDTKLTSVGPFVECQIDKEHKSGIYILSELNTQAHHIELQV